jgi:hypothetical protein
MSDAVHITDLAARISRLEADAAGYSPLAGVNPTQVLDELASMRKQMATLQKDFQELLELVKGETHAVRSLPRITFTDLNKSNSDLMNGVVDLVSSSQVESEALLREEISGAVRVVEKRAAQAEQSAAGVVTNAVQVLNSYITAIGS